VIFSSASGTFALVYRADDILSGLETAACRNFCRDIKHADGLKATSGKKFPSRQRPFSDNFVNYRCIQFHIQPAERTESIIKEQSQKTSRPGRPRVDDAERAFPVAPRLDDAILNVQRVHDRAIIQPLRRHTVVPRYTSGRARLQARSRAKVACGTLHTLAIVA